MSARDEALAAAAALTRALSALEAEVAEQESRVEAAEFGPHGRSDVIAAESERLDALRAAQERLESAKDDIEETARELEDLL